MKVRYLKSDELQHHGIKGQKWGVKNGPPYPIDKKTAKKNFKRIKEYKGDYSSNDFFIEKEVKDSISKKQLSAYKKAFSNKDNAEYKLENMRWDDFKKNGKEQGKKVTQATKEYEILKKQLAKELIGKYANRPIGTETSWGQTKIKRGKDAVGDILDKIVKNTYSEYYGDKNYYINSHHLKEN